LAEEGLETILRAARGSDLDSDLDSDLACRCGFG
jgi:hypothetical protein